MKFNNGKKIERILIDNIDMARTVNDRGRCCCFHVHTRIVLFFGSDFFSTAIVGHCAISFMLI